MPTTVETVPGKTVQPVAVNRFTTESVPVDPLILFLLVFLLSGLAGFAALLRSTLQITLRSILTWTLNSGVAGLGLFWVWSRYYGEDLWGLVGICFLVGLGGLPCVEFVCNAVRKGIARAGGLIRTDDSAQPKQSPPPGPVPPTGKDKQND